MKGRVTPPNWKSAPVTVSCDTVTLVEPVLVKTSGLVVLCPMAVLPKAMVGALGVSVPATTACALKLKVAEFCGAVVATSAVAVAEPALCGVY